MDRAMGGSDESRDSCTPAPASFSPAPLPEPTPTAPVHHPETPNSAALPLDGSGSSGKAPVEAYAEPWVTEPDTESIIVQRCGPPIKLVQEYSEC